MNPNPRGHRRPHRLRSTNVLAAVAALTAPLLLSATSGPTAAQAPTTSRAAADGPRLYLSAPKRQDAYGEGSDIYSDLGLRMVAEGADLELNLNRADYSSPIVASQRTASGLTQLGSGLTTSFNELDRFVRMRFVPLGKKPGRAFTRFASACLGAVSERIDPEADPRSPYPTYCNYNPYSLGAVQGISEGYAASVLSPWGTLRRIPKGRYRVEINVTRRWANALGMSATDRTRTTRLRVRDYDDCRRNCRRSSGLPTDLPSEAPRPSAQRPTHERAIDPADVPADYPKPDLRALPAWGMRIARNGNFLQFSATVWNGGNSPLVVDGFRRSKEDVMDGYQYFFDADGEQLADYARVGEFEWDKKPSHLHWHFRSFAAYSLLPVGHTPEAPDGHDDHHGVQSRKEAFCLANTDAVDLTGPGAQWNVDNSDLSTACGDYSSLSIREVLAAGWGDTYAQFRAGQSFNLKGLPNGCYNVWVEGNPILDHASGTRTLVESDYTNNTAKRRVCIGGKPGARTIRRIQKIGDIDEGDYGDYRRR